MNERSITNDCSASEPRRRDQTLEETLETVEDSDHNSSTVEDSDHDSKTVEDSDHETAVDPSTIETIKQLEDEETVGSEAATQINLDQTSADLSPRSGSIAMPAPRLSGASSNLHLFGQLGSGGMGAVLKGRDEHLRRDLAVKILLERHRNKPLMVRRFIEEAQIAGQLQHPGIVPVHELGLLDDDRPYFTMKLVKGHTLAQLLGRRETPRDDLPRFLGIFEQVCQTVAYAHSRGVIHRDLKPSNVMVGAFGEVQVMDWGLAKVLARDETPEPRPDLPVGEMETTVLTIRSEDDSDTTRTHAVLGTPSYMAPEQARGEVNSLDEQVDVFSLGAILCEILTRKPVFVGDAIHEIHYQASRGETGPALERLAAAGVEAELIQLARDCLAVEREDRLRDAGVVADRIAAYRAGVEQRLRVAELDRAAAEARAGEENKRRKWQLGLAAALLVLTLLGGLFASSVQRRIQSRAARIDLASNEIALLRNQALEDPSSVPPWREADRTARRISNELRNVHGARTQLRPLRDEIANGLAEALRDQRLLTVLPLIRSDRQDAGDLESDRAYAEAFADAGIDLVAEDPQPAVDHLMTRTPKIRRILAGYLDDWAGLRERAGAGPRGRSRILRAAAAADPDADRNRLRKLLETNNLEQHREALEALAEDQRSRPATAALLLAAALDRLEEPEQIVEVLQHAVMDHPEDIWVNFELAIALTEVSPPRFQEAMRYFTAARTIRPETAHAMGHVLERLGREDEAEIIFEDLTQRLGEQDRAAVRARHLGCFGSLLVRRYGLTGESSAILEQAIEAWRQAIKHHPDDSQAHNNLGLALANIGRRDEAVEAFQTAIRLEPDLAEARINLGQALANPQQPVKTLESFRDQVRDQPEDPWAHYNLGRALARDGQHEQAIESFDEAIRLRPDFAAAHTNRGLTLVQLGRIDEAIQAHREAVKSQPNFAKAHSNLGFALEIAGRLEEAIEAHRMSVQIRPDDPTVHTNLGNVLANAGRRDEAIQAFQEAIRLQPDLIEAQAGLEQTISQIDQLEETLRSYREIVRGQPDDPTAQINLAKTLAKMGRLGEAIPAYQRAIQLQPDDALIHYQLARLLNDAGRNEEAVESFDEAIRLRPDFAAAHTNRGLTLVQLGRIDEAIQAHREAVKSQPSFAKAHSNLGNALVLAERFDEALQAHQEAIRIRPESAELHYHHGNALGQAGRLDEALQAYREAVELEPDDKTYQSALKQAEVRTEEPRN